MTGTRLSAVARRTSDQETTADNIAGNCREQIQHDEVSNRYVGAVQHAYGDHGLRTHRIPRV